MDTFTTPRITAERLDARHLADLIPLHLDEEVSRHLGGVRDAAQTAAYLETNLAHWDRHGYGLWVLRERGGGDRAGAFMGRAGIRHVEVEGRPEVEIAYTFAKPFWGQGLAAEIAGALTQMGLGPMGLPSLVGIVDIPHIASRRVLEKTGYRLEGEALFHGFPTVVYRRLALTGSAGARP